LDRDKLTIGKLTNRDEFTFTEFDRDAFTIRTLLTTCDEFTFTEFDGCYAIGRRKLHHKLTFCKLRK
jgi:hypothetical protein